MRSHPILYPPCGLAGRWPLLRLLVPPPQRSVRHEAFDASFDQDELAEARKWHQSFNITRLPEGNTSYARSSGPGGQHVNKFVLRFLEVPQTSRLTGPERNPRQQLYGLLPSS